MPTSRRKKQKQNTSQKSGNSPDNKQETEHQDEASQHFGSTALSFLGLVVFLVLIYKYGRPQPQNIPLADTATTYRDEDIFVVRDLPGRGKGIIAARDIHRGELVIREQPLFVVPHSISSSPAELISTSLSHLGQASREAFFNLSYIGFPEDLEPRDHLDRVALAIFETNAVSAGDGVGIFPRMARLNHGCSSAFNVVYSWRTEESALVVHALKDIREGDELLTTYTNTKRPREQRRTFLQERYGFHCTCSVCSLPDKESRASDQRLVTISDHYDRFASWGAQTISGAEAIEVVREIWALQEDEGYWSERGQLAADAAFVAASHSDATATRDWAQLAAEWYSYELGSDSAFVVEAQKIAKEPSSHRQWGSRPPTKVGGLNG
ncbi:hypothetical protein BD779DRAFT_1498662 [Infundibulicybe gibba]|nr:hypothetical protein BD779DRAFT_1498662 [Infundibulicybe gibba]